MDNSLEIRGYLDASFPSFEPALKEKISKNSLVKSFSAGDIIMRTGQYIRFSVLIASGSVKLYREHEDGGEAFMYYLVPGSACALSMICAVKQETSQIMAKAEEDTTAIMIPIQLMDELMRDYKSWYYFVLENYRMRFEELLTVLDHVLFKGMDERLEFYLKNQFKKAGAPQLKLTHQEIANDLNSSREVISRLLKKMEQDGKLKLYRSYIEYLNNPL